MRKTKRNLNINILKENLQVKKKMISDVNSNPQITLKPL